MVNRAVYGKVRGIGRRPLGHKTRSHRKSKRLRHDPFLGRRVGEALKPGPEAGVCTEREIGDTRPRRLTIASHNRRSAQSKVARIARLAQISTVVAAQEADIPYK